MLRTARVNKVFSPGIFINIKKNRNKHETCFCDYNIQKWLRFKRVITIISHKYLLMDLK